MTQMAYKADECVMCGLDKITDHEHRSCQDCWAAYSSMELADRPTLLVIGDTDLSKIQPYPYVETQEMGWMPTRVAWRMYSTWWFALKRGMAVSMHPEGWTAKDWGLFLQGCGYKDVMLVDDIAVMDWLDYLQQCSAMIRGLPVGHAWSPIKHLADCPSLLNNLRPEPLLVCTCRLEGKGEV